MSLSKATVKNRNRAIRQEALREQLSSQKHIEHVVDCINKMQDESQDIDPAYVTRLKIAIDSRLKLVNKYLPDLKAMELDVVPDSPLADILGYISGKQDGLPTPTDDA